MNRKVRCQKSDVRNRKSDFSVLCLRRKASAERRLDDCGLSSVFCSLVFVAALCLGCSSTYAENTSCPEKKNAVKSKVDIVLEALRKKVAELKSYEANIQYIFRQPLLESETQRRGVLYYKKEPDRSKLRINFETIKQDDEEEEKYVEHFIFDGVWLVEIDYQLAQANFYQKAPEDEPINALDLAGEQLPIIGFSNIEKLQEQFDITLVQSDSKDCNEVNHLHLKTKSQSTYKDRYRNIDIWIDKITGLPKRIVAKTPTDEDAYEDIYDIRLNKTKFNKKIKSNVFKVTIPKDFSIKREPLRKEENREEKG